MFPENGALSEEAQDTVDFIIFIDNLFDSLNGSFKNSKNRSGKDLLLNVTPTSKHKNFWIQARNILKTIKFITPSGSSRSVPTVNNWLHTIKGMELLRDTIFNSFDMKSLWCRHMNQDPIENFFGSIRSHGLRNTSPTYSAFEAAFASLLINDMSSNYSPGSNCEEDMCSVFTSFEEVFFVQTTDQDKENCEVDLEDVVADITIVQCKTDISPYKSSAGICNRLLTTETAEKHK